MMSTPLDRYFELLDSSDEKSTKSGEIGDLFVEDGEILYGGEIARGRTWIVQLHRSVLSRRKRSVHSWTTKAEGNGLLVARWSEAGLDVQGRKFTAGGSASAALDDSGRITNLRLSFGPEGTDRARVIIGRYLEVWLVEDPEERLRKMKDIYADDIRFTEMDEVFQGHAALNDHMGMVNKMAPPTFVQLDGFIQNHDYIQTEWSFVALNGGKARGRDVLHLAGNLIDSVVVFSSNMNALVDGVQ